jgi:protein phosphatase
MADRWYYMHEGQVHGPVPTARIMELAAACLLLPQDLIWPEGSNPAHAIEAQGAVDFTSLPPPPAPPAPDWLADVAEVEKAPRRTTAVAAGKPTTVKAPQAAPAPSTPAPPPPAPVQPVPGRLDLSGATSRGRVRERNEDCFAIQQWTWSAGEDIHEMALIVVADGMGGHQAGDHASRLVVATVAGWAFPLVGQCLADKDEARAAAALANTLEEAIREANGVVHQQAQSDARYKGMGATAAVVLIWKGRAIIAHVGDCRVYHLRGSSLTQVTRDQTLVARMVELGQISEEEAAQHPARNEVSQAVGKRTTIEPGRYEQELQPGDWLVVACDGLTAHVDEKALQGEVSRAGQSATALARRLVDLANEGGGTDNCTVVAAYRS